MASLFRWAVSVNKWLGYFLKIKNQVAFAGKWAWPAAPTIYPTHLQTLALLCRWLTQNQMWMSVYSCQSLCLKTR